ncbi:11691_t:CDS:1, partial [Acaulospora colombiana]
NVIEHNYWQTSTVKEWDDEGIRTAIKFFRNDKGGEYSSKALENFCKDHGISLERTIRDTPQQNGVAERFNRTLAEAVTSMLSQSKLPPSFWADAVGAYTHIHNRLPSHSRGNKTPYEMWNGKIPSVAHIRVWGCLAHVHLQKDQRKQLEPHSRRCVFIGYPIDYKGWRFLDLKTRREFISDSAVFDEDQLPGLTHTDIPFPSPSSTTNTSNPTTPAAALYLPPPPIARRPPALLPPPLPTINPPDGDALEPPPEPASTPRQEVSPNVEWGMDNSVPPTPIKSSASTPPREVQSNVDDILHLNSPLTQLSLSPPPSPSPAAKVPENRSESPSPPREVRRLMDHFEHFPHNLPEKRTREPVTARQAYWEDNEVGDFDWYGGIETETAYVSLDHPAKLLIKEPLASVLKKSHFQIPPDEPPSKPLPLIPWQPPNHRSNFVFIPFHNAIDCALSVSTQLEPSSLKEALRRSDADKWVEAAADEIGAHMRNGTWELVPLPAGRKAIGSRWVFKIKKNADGSIERYKGRIVAKGYAQREGVDFTDTFAPTARFGALRTVIALAAIEDLHLESVDISTAFLNGEIDTEVYMELPEGLEAEGDPKVKYVVKLLKSLYGIKQAPRIWSKKLLSELKALGFQRLECDHSVFIYERDDVRVIVPVYVDDLVIASKSQDAIDAFKSQLRSRFKMREQGPTTFILGIKLERDRPNRTIKLSQSTYIENMIEKYIPHEILNGVDVPMKDNEPLSTKMCPQTPDEIEFMSKIPYREAVGKLLYLSIATRPDISYAVGVLCRYNANPGQKHWAAVKHLLRYLSRTKDLKLCYSPDSSMEPFTTYSDADLGGNIDNSRSTAGFLIKVGTGVVHWGSKLHRQTSLSTTESEYTTASASGCELMWMRYFLEEIGYDMSKPSLLKMDSASAIQVAKNPEHISTMKHVHRCYNWIREKVEETKEIRIAH